MSWVPLAGLRLARGRALRHGGSGEAVEPCLASYPSARLLQGIANALGNIHHCVLCSLTCCILPVQTHAWPERLWQMERTHGPILLRVPQAANAKAAGKYPADVVMRGEARWRCCTSAQQAARQPAPLLIAVSGCSFGVQHFRGDPTHCLKKELHTTRNALTMAS